jgi:SPP1 family predicted phage head-tail adaptor
MSTMQNPEVNAGDLDRRVTLLSPVYNTYQDEIVDWSPVAQVWAKMAPNFGQEINEAGRTVAVVQSIVNIRYRSDIDARWRLQMGSRLFEVAAILNPMERRAQLQLNCKEVL